jgi:hypothetical protein
MKALTKESRSDKHADGGVKREGEEADAYKCVVLGGY